MKTTIKSIITRVVALALTFITGSALAATPTAVIKAADIAAAQWNDGVATINGLTLTLNGNTLNSDGTITIESSATKGVRVDAGSKTISTILVKAKGYAPQSSGNVEVVVAMTMTGDSDKSKVGLGAKSDKKCWYIWDGTAWGNTQVSGSALFNDTGSHTYALSYENPAVGQITQGTTMYIDGTRVMQEAGLRDSGLTHTSVATIGGTQRTSDTLSKAVGLTIEAIAIFDSSVSSADAAAYDFDFPALMYGNKLATNTELVPAGTYGDIVVSGNGYKATKFTAKTKITGGEGSYDKIQYKVGGNNDTRTHTVSGWFKVSAYDRLVYTALSNLSGDHGGYKVYCNSSGNLEIGKCNGGNFNWNGNKVTAQTALQLDTWYYLTFAITKNDANRKAKVVVLVNGSVVYNGTDEFETNLNGNNCVEFDIGADVSAAGLYIDATAVTNVATIKNWATNEKLVEAALEVSTATINGESSWSNLGWSKDPESVGLVKITVAGDSTLTIDKDVSVADLVFAGSGALTIKGEHTLTATSFDIGSFTLASGALSIPANNTLTSVTVEDGAVLTLDVSSAKTLNGISGAGKLVKTGAAKLSVLIAKTGDIAVNGTTIQIEQGRIVFGDGSKDPLMSNPTFIIGENGSLENYGWFTINGTLTINSAYDKVIFTNTNADSGTGGRNAKLQGAPAIVKKGTGAVTICASEADIPSITVEDGSIGFNGTQPLSFASNATFDFTKLPNKTNAPINGAFTFADTYTFKFPADWAAGETFQLCSGTLSGIPEGGKVEEYTFYLGDTPVTHTLNLSSDGSIYYNTGVKKITAAEDYAISSLNGETIEEGQTVELTIAAGKTLTIDETAKVTTAVICDGILCIVGADGAEPTAEQLAALNFEGVSGKIVKKWLATMGVININLNSGNGKFTDGDASDDGMLAGNTPKSSWINTTGATGTLTDINEWKTLTQESAAVSGMTFTWDANKTWYANATIPIRGGYLDDGKANGVTLTLASVPYEMYDVIVYYSTDQGGGLYQPLTVNGVTYTGDKTTKTTAIGNATWGDNAVVASVEEGVNTLRVHDLAGDVTIHTAQRNNSTRGCVAAIQIVEVPAKEYRREYTAAENVDVKTSDLNTYIAGGDSYTGPFTLTLNGGKFIADADFVCSALAINSATDLTIEKADAYTISDTEMAKIAVNEFGGAKITYVNLAIIPATAPAAGKTYRWEGDMTLAAIPFVGSVVEGTIEINCPLASLTGLTDGKITGSKNSIVFGPDFSCEDSIGFVRLGNNGGQTQNFTQNGGALTLNKSGNDGVSTDRAFTIAHWNGNVTYNFVAGKIDVPNDNTVLGWDGTAHMTIGGGTTAAIMTTKGIATGQSNNNDELTISENGTLAIGSYGADFKSNTTVTLAGGTLDAYETCTFAAANVNGIQVTANSTINIPEGVTLTIAAPLSGAGNITVVGDGTLKLTGSVAGFTGKITATKPIDLSNKADLSDGIIGKIVGSAKLGFTMGESWMKIADGMTELPAITLVDATGATISKLCIYDNALYYGENGGDTYTFTDAEIDQITNITTGAICKIPCLNVNAEKTANDPDGYFCWFEGGYVCAAKKSNSISLKTGTRTKDRDSAIRATDEAVGGFPVAGKFWNNAKLWNDDSTSNPFTEYLTLKDGNGEDTEVAVAYRAPNTYFPNGYPSPTNGNMRLTASYLDDGATAGSTQWTVDKGDGTLITLPAAPNARGWQFQVSNIPYDMYDLYVYIASDVSPESALNACPVVISCDGVNWTYYAGSAKGDDSTSWKPYAYAHDGEVVEGKNYIRFRISKNSTGLGDISTIHITHGTRDTNAKKRLGLAGIQIVEIDDDGVRDRVVVGDGAQNWHDAAAWKKTNKEGVASNVDWVDATENPITARVNAEEVPALVMDSDALATKLEVTGGTVEAPVEFTLSGSGTLTTETIDATKLHGTLNFEAPVKGTISLATDSYLVIPVSGTIDSLDEIMPEGLSITSGKLKLRGDAAFTALTNDFSQIPVSVIDITETSCNVPMIIGANQTVIVDGSKWTSEAIFAAATSRITFKGNYSAVPGTFSGAQGIINFAGTFASATDLTDSGLNYYLEFSGALTAPNVNFTNFKQFTTLQGCDINVETNMTIYGADGSRQIYLTYGQVTVGETLRVYGGNGQYGRFHFGNDSDDPESCVITAKTVNSASQGTVIDAYQLNAGLTVNLGVGGWSLSGHGSYPDYAKMELHGTKIVATGDTFLSPNKFNVTADSTLEVSAETTLTLRKVLAGNAKVIKTGEGTLVLAAGESSAVQVNAGTLKMAAGNEANVTVGGNGGLTLTVTEEQWINGYTSTAAVPDGKDITFLDPAGNVIEGTTGKVLPIKPGVKTWTGATDDNWNVGTNWDPVGVPDTDGIVKINATNDVDVAITLNDAVTIVTLMIDGANSVTLSGAALSITEDIKKNGAGKLTIEDLATVGAYAWNAGDLELGGAFAVPAVAIPADGTLTLVVDEAKSVTSVISGAGKLVKAGEGTLTLSVQNTFSGGLKIVGGVVKMGNYLALGPSGSVVEIARGATLDMADTNGINGYYTAQFINEGEGNVGRLIKSTTTHLGVGKTYPIRHIVLDEGADAEIYVEEGANCGLVGQGYGESSITLNGNTLTKTGAGLFYFANTTVNGQGVISLEAGTISVEHGALTANDATLKVGTDATLNVADATTVKNLEMNGTRTGASALEVKGVLSGTGNVGYIVLGEDSSLDATKGPITVTSLNSNADKLIIKCPPTGGKLIKGLALDLSANVVLIDPKTGEEIPAKKVTLSFKNGTLAFSLNGFMLMLK